MQIPFFSQNLLLDRQEREITYICPQCQTSLLKIRVEEDTCGYGCCSSYSFFDCNDCSHYSVFVLENLDINVIDLLRALKILNVELIIDCLDDILVVIVKR